MEKPYLSIDVSQKLLTFDGKNIKLDDSPESADVTLKDILIQYVRSSGRMGLKESDHDKAYVIGVKVGVAEETASFTKEEARVLRIISSGKVKGHDGETSYIHQNPEIRVQVQNMVSEK